MSCGGSSSGSCTSIGNVFVVTASVTNFASTTDVTIDTGGGIATVNVLRVKVKHTAGSAATFTPRLYNLSGAASGSINMQFEGSSTAVATLFDVACDGCVFQTDTSGQFFLEPGPNAGSDNSFTYEISYEVV
ncbi:MAG: hypothetical protein RLZZ299_725 [Pseudomonadota bacterium]|jgi:hypothetical protein